MVGAFRPETGWVRSSDGLRRPCCIGMSVQLRWDMSRCRVDGRRAFAVSAS